MQDTVSIVTTLRAPRQQIIDFVNFHVNAGVDRVFLYFDDPSDPVAELVEQHKQVTVTRCTKAYWKRNDLRPDAPIEARQRVNADHALAAARNSGYGWISHIDIDELIYVQGGVKRLLSALPQKVDYVRLPPLEAIPEKLTYERLFLEVQLFRNYFWKLSKGSFRGHIAGKSIVRTASGVKRLGIHVPDDQVRVTQLRSAVSLRMGRLLHFNCCGFEDWRRKWIWRTDGTGQVSEGGALYKSMAREFSSVARSGVEMDLERLYTDQFFIQEWKKRILRRLGVLVQIVLDAERFRSTW